MTRCPRCDCPSVDHLWRADMPRLQVIDEWKCLDPACGYRWDAGAGPLQPAESAAVPVPVPVDDAEADSRAR